MFRICYLSHTILKVENGAILTILTHNKQCGTKGIKIWEYNVI